MKKEFHAYYRPTDEEFKVIWDEALIVLDANVMLNLYTYSSTTSQEILELFGEFGDRLWMPHQVALEYHSNRCGIILKESKRYKEVENALDVVGVALRAKKQHPHITAELAEKFKNIETEIKKELVDGASNHRELISADSICKKITEYFAGRVGASMTDEVLDKIYKKGVVRYAKKIPPGFCDSKKPEPNKYGDLVLWYQLIEHAEKVKRPVIFVTDDLKDDWWKFAGDKRIGPRPELRHEFQRKTECDIYIYSSDAFIETSTERGKKLSDSATKEVENASKERQLDADEKRTMERLARHNLLVKAHRHHEAIRRENEERMRVMHEPYEVMRREQEERMRVMHEPYEVMRREQEEREEWMRDPYEAMRREEEERMRLMHEPYEVMRREQEEREERMSDPYEAMRREEEERMRDPYEAIRREEEGREERMRDS